MKLVYSAPWILNLPPWSMDNISEMSSEDYTDLYWNWGFNYTFQEQKVTNTAQFRIKSLHSPWVVQTTPTRQLPASCLYHHLGVFTLHSYAQQKILTLHKNCNKTNYQNSATDGHSCLSSSSCYQDAAGNCWAYHTLWNQGLCFSTCALSQQEESFAWA